MNDKAFFFYIHKDLGGDSNWRKIGIAMTPYSAVRARQKNLSKEFSLDHVYFGIPSDIAKLETNIKNIFKHMSGSILNNIAAQTEMFKISETDLLDEIHKQIVSLNLHVEKCVLAVPYSAANSGACPLGIPCEQNSHEYLTNILENKYGFKIKKAFKNNFPNLFLNTTANSISQDDSYELA